MICRRTTPGSTMTTTMLLALVVVFCTTPIAKGVVQQQSFRIRPKHSEVLEGHEVTLRCEVENRSGFVQWVKDGFAYVVQTNGEIVGHPRLRLVGEQTAGVYNLHIRNASLSDDGEYQCQVGPFHKIKSIRANARLNVLSPPQSVEITPTPEKSEVQVGQSVQISCTVRMAKPAARIIWYRQNAQIKGGDSMITSIPIEEGTVLQGSKKRLEKYNTNASITIVPTADDDGVLYACEASHPAIPAARPMRATVKLSVLYPPGQPYIEGYSEGETLHRGQEVELICKSRGGNPPARIEWFRNNEKVTSIYRTESSVSASSYTFTAQATDDKSRYTCKVSNSMTVSPMLTHVDLRVLFAPKSVKIDGPHEARVNETVTLTCTSENSNPAADITWNSDKEGIVFNSTSRSYLAPEGGWITTSNITYTVRADDKIVFMCHGNNKNLLQNVVKTHSLSVIYPPTALVLNGYDGESYINTGTVIELICTALSGNPLPEITWYKNDKIVDGEIFSREDLTVSSKLTFVVNASDNEANVRCEAANSAMKIPLRKNVTLKVYFPPENVKIRSYPEKLRAGSVGRLVCESSSSNPAAEMSWWESGTPIKKLPTTNKPGLHGGYLSTVELLLNLTEDMNDKVYTCQARATPIVRTAHDAITLNVMYKPIFEEFDPSELSGMEGEPFAISVVVNANPSEVSYTWKRDGLPLSNNARRIIARSSTLNITRLERQDAGIYTVEAINHEGRAFYNLSLNVKYPARIIRTSPSGIVHLPFQEAVLFCEIDASPMDQNFVSWYKVGSNVDFSSRYSTSFNNNTSYLHIRDPGQEDVGEYQCVVNNGIGNDTSSPILFLTNFMPEMMNTPLTRKAASNKGVAVQLFCRAQGSPMPQFSWTFEGKTLPTSNSHKYSLASKNVSALIGQSVLTINRVTDHDYGKYQCHAKNSMGHTNDTVVLTRTSEPDQPSDLEVYNVTHDSVTLIWKRGFDGGLATSHRIRWREALDHESRYKYMDISPGDYKATVSGLSLGTYYVFSIQARNTMGESHYLPDLVKVQTLRPNKAENLPDVLLEKGDFPMNYIYTIAATSMVFFIVNLFIMFWYIVRKRNKDRINKSQTADMYAPSTVNGDTMTGELSSVSDEKSDVNFDANDYVDEGRKTAASTYLIDSSIPDYSKSSLEMQVHHQGTLSRRNNHLPGMLNMDSPPQRTTASGTLSASKSSYIGNPSPAPPIDVNFYSMERDSGHFMGYEGNPSPVPVMGEPGPGAYYTLGSTGHLGPQMHAHSHPHVHPHSHHMVGMTATGTLTRNRTLPRPVPPPDVTVMTAGKKSPPPPSVPPPPATFALADPGPALSHGHPLSTFSSKPYSDIDGHLV